MREGIEVASGAVGFIARHNIHRRRRSLLVITIVVGLVGAVVLASSAGARRTASSLERFETSSRAASVELTMLGRPTRKQLAELHASGALTDDEFAAAKAKALGIG